MSGLLRVAYCLRRRPELDYDRFREYWSGVHAPLVEKHADAMGIRGYLLHHPTSPRESGLLADGRGTPEHYDGIAELHVEPASFAGPPSDAAKAAGRELRVSELRFIDMARSPIVVIETEVRIPAPEEAR
jgi:hypothetical protein